MGEVPDTWTAAVADRYRVDLTPDGRPRMLGQGGMASVYSAVDVKHLRKVAIKLLRPHLAAVVGAERFLQEVRLTASLQHPHILGLLDSGVVTVEDGPDARLSLPYYVMPLVEGESLRDLLKREIQLPVEVALKIAIAVASALHYAHRHGVVHRDIKPENILLHDGHALVADFGIALALTTAGAARLTESGIALGTPKYMSPEQGLGQREVDARTDIYSLGCVVYEMLAGEPPFTGPTAQAIVIRSGQDAPRALRADRPNISVEVEAAVMKALAKLPADRFATADEFSIALSKPGQSESHLTTSENASVSQTGRSQIRTVALLVIGVILGVLATRVTNSGRQATANLARVTVMLADGQHLDPFHPDLAITSDGQYLAYLAVERDTTRLYLRSIQRFESSVVPQSEGADFAFFSPDGKWIGFFVGSRLFKAPVTGGGPTLLAELRRSRGSWTYDGGATWGNDNKIYVGQRELGIWAVDAAGGVPVQITTPDSTKELGHGMPRRLPDGRILFATWDRSDRGSLALLTPRDRSVIHVASQVAPAGGWFVSPSHLLYATATGSNGINAVAFDVKRGTASSSPLRILEDAYPRTVAVSDRGTVAYAAVPGRYQRRIVVVDRHGNANPAATRTGGFHRPSLSPDGARLAVENGVDNRVWVLDLAAQTWTPMAPQSSFPSWSPDGLRIVFWAHADAATRGIYSQAADGSDSPAPLSDKLGTTNRGSSFTSDGRWFASTELVLPDPVRIVISERDGKRSFRVSGSGAQSNPRFSPNGRWLAYQSDESGRWEVYVQPFPSLDRKILISSDGGTEPVWSKDERQLFFRSEDRMMAVLIDQSPRLLAGRPQPLFDGLSRYMRDDEGASYAVAPDGRFIMIEANDAAQIRVVLNFAAELDRLLPR